MPKRRAEYGTGSVRHKSGGWELTVWHQGKRTIRRHPGPDTRAGRRDAEDALDRLARSIRADAEDLTIAELVHRYLAVGTFAPSTQKSNPYHAARIVEALGDVRVVDLTDDDVRDAFAVWRAAGTKAGTIRRRKAVLSAALHLVEGKLILRAPTDLVKVENDDQAALDLQELPSHAAVEAAIARWADLAPHPRPGQLRGLRRMHVTCALALGSGARRGELCGLRWPDLDLEVGDMHVRSAISVGPGDELVRKLTKGRQARTIRLDPEVVDELKRWRREQRETCLALGVPFARDMPVLPSPRDPREVWNPERITMTWDRHRARIGLPTMGFHDLRHRHATTLLDEGVAIHTVSARLGHANAYVTYAIYTHACRAGDEHAARALADARARGRALAHAT